MEKAFEAVLGKVKSSWALKNPEAWVDRWSKEQVFLGLETRGVDEHVWKLNRLLVKNACLACQTGNKRFFEALRESSAYEGDYGPVRHLDTLTPNLFWKLLRQDPASLLNLKAWTKWDENHLLHAALKDFVKSTWISEGVAKEVPMTSRQWLYAACQTSRAAEEVGEALFPGVRVEDLPLRQILRGLSAFRQVVSAEARLERAIKKVLKSAVKSKTEQEQWTLLNAVGINWRRNTKVHAWTCGAMDVPFSIKGMRTWLEKEGAVLQSLSTEDGRVSWVSTVLDIAIQYGTWNFSEESQRFVSSLKNEHDAQRMERLVAEGESRLDRLRLKARHLTESVSGQKKAAL